MPPCSLLILEFCSQVRVWLPGEPRLKRFRVSNEAVDGRLLIKNNSPRLLYTNGV